MAGLESRQAHDAYSVPLVCSPNGIHPGYICCTTQGGLAADDGAQPSEPLEHHQIQHEVSRPSLLGGRWFESCDALLDR